MIEKLRMALLMAPALLVGWSAVAASHEHHSTYSAGEPGDPKKPSREIVVEMSEMDYSPSRIEVKHGSRSGSLCTTSVRKTMNSFLRRPRTT